MGSEVPSLAQRVLHEVRCQVSTGVIAPGTRLSQTELATRLGVSRIPLREGLQQLAIEGLITLDGGGAVVATPLSVDELQEVYEIREAIEPRLTQLAVPNVGRAEILRMRTIQVEMLEAEDTAAWLGLNTEFHRAVYARAPRPRMIELVERYRALADRYIHVLIDVRGDTAALDDQHDGILRAVEARDSALAGRLTREHLESSHDFVLRHFVAADDSRR
ncbi:GntR family transcriptional regulator [Georgenia sp. 10Sc9-8]|uniref:GntR family transcriptional regulator n=1 Tax=Georgenia halotolerans TaxID=3028317 RepID=A0ABT5TX32_9MICO|nr:GntR family transcriptional regulator [Georgenia halotolerans]